MENASEAVIATNPEWAEGSRLRARFPRRGDRFGHEVEVVSASGQVVPLLASVEGTAEDPWPTCPPLQQLSLEVGADGQTVALLLGMAGVGHWSMSVEPREATLVFDVACRIPAAKQSPWLGSTYRWLSAPRTGSTDGENDHRWGVETPFTLWQTGSAIARLQILAIAHYPHPAGRTDNERLAVELPNGSGGVDGAGGTPTTVRWKYLVGLG